MPRVALRAIGAVTVVLALLWLFFHSVLVLWAPQTRQASEVEEIGPFPHAPRPFRQRIVAVGGARSPDARIVHYCTKCERQTYTEISNMLFACFG
jgi:hypothetical protein